MLGEGLNFESHRVLNQRDEVVLEAKIQRMIRRGDLRIGKEVNR
jgi:hypothetical protein